jgi:hypothetical protein
MNTSSVLNSGWTRWLKRLRPQDYDIGIAVSVAVAIAASTFLR